MVEHSAKSVWPVREIRRDLDRQDETGNRILGVLQRWAGYANQQYADWDGRPECGHFFGGSYWYMGETLNTALALAVASSFGGWDERAIGVERSTVRLRVARALRYACLTHDTGPADCVRATSALTHVSGRKWGGAGDGFFMASQNGRSIALLACTTLLMWDQLDNETRVMIQLVISSYADRWYQEEPRNGAYYDTQCEENSWTAAGIGAAMVLYADHPRHSEWSFAFRRWARNAVTCPADRSRHPHGLIDRVSGETIETVTFHPDFTTENHGFVHPAYMCAGINLRGLYLVLASMTGAERDPAATRNNERLYDETIRYWTQSDGVVTPVQGQDWWYNRQHDALVTHALMSVYHANTCAARFEQDAITAIEGIQASNNRGCLLEERGEECVINANHGQYANQLEHGSAANLAVGFLIHRFGGRAADPGDKVSTEDALAGVRHYPFGGVIVHRTPASFTSFSYRNHVMAYAAPSAGMWTVTPHYQNYLGSVTPAGTDTSGEEPVINQADDVSVAAASDGFTLAARVPRCDGNIEQQIVFASLPAGKCLYAERLRVRDDAILEIATGLIGVRNEDYRAIRHLAPGKRRLHHPGGSLEFEGYYGRTPDRVEHLPPTEWLNLDDQIGYRLYGSAGVRYLNRHVYRKWRGVEDQLVLNFRSREKVIGGTTLPAFAVVTTVNETALQTAADSGAGRLLSCDESTLAFEEGDYLVFGRFARETGPVELRGAPRNRVHLYPGRQRIRSSGWNWSDWATGPCVRRLTRVLTAELDEVAHDLLAVVSHRTTMIENLADRPVSFRVRYRNGRTQPLVIPGGGHATIETDSDRGRGEHE